MPFNFIEDQQFLREDFLLNPFTKGDYEACSFSHCNFSKTDLSNCRFIDCSFSDCNLSNAKLVKTGFQEVTFKSCKMLGLRFDACDGFGFSIRITSCLLDHGTFYKTRLTNTVFADSRLHGVDFTESDLSAAIFDHCDLCDAVFDHSILEGTDFTKAVNFSIDPEKNRLKGAKFALTGLPGLLSKYGLKIT